jgi:hypothetical protein
MGVLLPLLLFGVAIAAAALWNGTASGAQAMLSSGCGALVCITAVQQALTSTCNRRPVCLLKHIATDYRV